MLASPVHILRYGLEVRAEMLYNYLPLFVIRKSPVRQCFESLENKMSSARFASLNEAELDQITDSWLSKNTKNAKKYAVKTFLSQRPV